MMLFWCFIYFILQFSILGKADDETDKKGSAGVDYQRHVIEEDVKGALFGSGSYDPVKKVFEALHSKDKEGDKEVSTVLNDAGDAGTTESETDATTTEAPSTASGARKRFDAATLSAASSPDWWSKFKALRTVKNDDANSI